MQKHWGSASFPVPVALLCRANTAFIPCRVSDNLSRLHPLNFPSQVCEVSRFKTDTWVSPSTELWELGPRLWGCSWGNHRPLSPTCPQTKKGMWVWFIAARLWTQTWVPPSTWDLISLGVSKIISPPGVHARVPVSFHSYLGIKRKGWNFYLSGRFRIRTLEILEGLPWFFQACTDSLICGHLAGGTH